MTKKAFLILIAIAVSIIFACCSRKPLLPDISKIEIDPVTIHRYEKALFSINPDSLQIGLKTIAADFPIFLEADLDNPQNILQLYEFVTDPLNQKLHAEVIKHYPDLENLEADFTKAFKYFRYHFPENQLPDIFTFVSGLVFDKPVQMFNGDMIVALDMYLGNQLEEYRRIRMPLYRIERMNSEHILKDAMLDFYYYNFLELQPKDFLSQMINKGRHLYFLDLVLPQTPDNIKIGFKAEQLKWCYDNESNLWGFMIQNELFYKNDTPLIRKFFADGPFTSDFTGEAPARLGEWMGWQIVRSFMKNNPQVTFGEMVNDLDAQTILNRSGYKPRR
jgi:hypothetical protein